MMHTYNGSTGESRSLWFASKDLTCGPDVPCKDGILVEDAKKFQQSLVLPQGGATDLSTR